MQSFLRNENKVVGTFSNVKLAFIFTIYQKRNSQAIHVSELESLSDRLRRTSSTKKKVLTSRY